MNEKQIKRQGGGKGGRKLWGPNHEKRGKKRLITTSLARKK